MKRIRLMFCLACAVPVASLAVLAFVLAGCETEPAQDFAIGIDPQIVEIRENGTVAFYASGGVRYVWALNGATNVVTDSSDPWGILSATSGDVVYYTCLRSPTNGEEHVLQTLTVTGSLGTAGGSNTTSYSASATAYIYILP